MESREPSIRIDPNHEVTADLPRRCIACGYNLRGLGDEPRCPECGLLHVPASYRQQIWDLVDSGKWFFSEMFSPFRKRLPGWWWALDREGDVNRSFWVAGRNILLAAFIVFSTCAVFEALVVRQTQTWSGTDIDGKAVSDVLHRAEARLFRTIPHDHYAKRRRAWSGTTFSSRITFDPSAGFAGPGVLVLLLLCLVWLCPGCVGLWTQIRKDLPAFARAPRTIIAAANLESHRVVYTAMLSALWMMLDLILRWRIGTDYAVYGAAFWASAGVFYLVAALGWIGPLRSDYTAQLIRSRWHTLRIILMYAIVTPAFVVFTLSFAVLAWRNG